MCIRHFEFPDGGAWGLFLDTEADVNKQSSVLKEQIVRLHKKGRNNSEIAEIIGYDCSTVSKFLKRLLSDKV